MNDASFGAANIEPATFRTQLDTTFRVEFNGDYIPLRLAEVIEGRTGGGIQQFSLFFHGPVDRLLEQGTYAFQHEALGSLMLFIVPVIDSNAERIVYQASFTRSAARPSAE